jgi:serine/threonine protein phosphatase PrpC
MFLIRFYSYYIFTSLLGYLGKLKSKGANPTMKIRFASGDGIGPRPTMEDRCYLSGNLNADGRLGSQKHLAYFGVYDGHNGDYVSEYLKTKFHLFFVEYLQSNLPRKVPYDVSNTIVQSITISLITLRF